jgi:CheY-like chemotaxis protein
LNDPTHNFILIIDDSVDNRALLTMLLEAKGFRVMCASNGEEALDLLRELAYLPNLILLDAQMPVMDGYKFRELQCKTDRLRSIPVIVMTGDCCIQTDERMNHPQAIMIKPLNVKSLLESVLPYLDEGVSHRSPWRDS